MERFSFLYPTIKYLRTMKNYNYTLNTSEVNRNFKIKFYGTMSDGSHVNKLVGVTGMVAELGEELASKLVDDAMNSTDDKFNRKLRRGLQVTFYVH